MPLTSYAALGAAPLDAGEFTRLMAPLGPFSAGREVAVAVSGGADSTALALLAAGWGRLLALIVDHGLRPESTAEAAGTVARLAAYGIASRVLTVSGLRPGPAMQERARAARRAALAQACRQAGLVDVLLGHHAADQAETVLMRDAAGSGPNGLAGMAAVAHAGDVRLLRPLLTVPPARLRATLLRAGLNWIEDPTNHDPATLRARLRRSPMPGASERLDTLAGSGAARAAADRGVEGDLAGLVAIRPEGFALLAPAALRPELLRRALWTVSGREFPPSPAGVEAWLAWPRPATLHGVQLILRAREGAWLLCREPAACAPPVPAGPGARWDGRYVVCRSATLNHGWSIGALGDASAGLRRRSNLPAAILRSLPAFRDGDALAAVPHLDFPDQDACRRARVLFSPAQPLAGLAFVPAGCIRGCTDEGASLS